MHLPSNRTNIITKQSGLSLVELMIAVLVSLVLIGGLLQMLVNNMSTYRTHVALARVQENSRFISQELAHEFRMAGMAGCSRFPTASDGTSSVTKGTIPSANTTDSIFYDITAGSLTGYDSKADDVIKNANFVSDIDANSSIIVIKRMADTSTYLSAAGVTYDHDSDPVTAPIPRPYFGSSENDNFIGLKDKSSLSLSTGDVLIINDCVGNVGLTQITNVTDANNDNRVLINAINKDFPIGSEIGKLTTYVYYIGAIGQNGRTEKALTKRTITADGTQVVQDLISGIESLTIHYGIDTDNDETADHFLTASLMDTTLKWSQAVAIRAGYSTAPPEAFTKGVEGQILHKFTYLINLRNPVYKN